MSGYILCQTKKAQRPYFIENISMNIYSIEELCYYLHHNLYLADHTVFNEELCNWLRDELELVHLAAKLKQNLERNVSVEEMIYPGGEDGAMLLDRVLPVFDEILHTDAKQVAVVCHGGVIRVLLCALFGGSFARRLQFGTSLENCSITAIHYDETLHGFFLDRFNDSAHLEGHPELFRGH